MFGTAIIQINENFLLPTESPPAISVKLKLTFPLKCLNSFCVA